MPYLKKGNLAFRRNELRNVARRAGFNLSRHWANWSGGFWLYRLKARSKRSSFPCRYSSNYSLDFCPTDSHTVQERVYVYCMTRRS
jgi:hypothetical protein